MTDKAQQPARPDQKRLFAGAAVLVLAQFAPLMIPLVVATDLPDGWKTVLSTFLILGVPEAGILLSAAILGREGFAWLKGKIFGYLKRALPPDRVSPLRHRIGVTMFVLPLLAGWLLPYLMPVLDNYVEYSLKVNIVGDVLLVLSLFVLGGEFWDKLRGLFLQRAVIQDPGKAD